MDRTRTWRAGAWAAWAVAVAAHFAAALVAAVFVRFGASTTCNRPATAANVTEGLRDLAVAAALLATGWLGAVLFARARWPRMVGGWLIGVSPLVAVAVTHTRAQDWVGNFCF